MGQGAACCRRRLSTWGSPGTWVADALVLPLTAIGRADLPRAGGKGANLGELLRAGFSVPEGFCLTTAAYRRRGAGGVPPEVAAACLEAYRALGGGPVAVRSSATAEDLPGASFAGQQETYLNIVGEDALIAAIPRCWASLYTERAVAYRASLGMDDADLALAVVVQRMVEARAAGVLFTADPVTGHRRHAVIDASGGLGEAVVSGAVDPDRYIVDRIDGRILERRIGAKQLRIEAVAGGGIRRIAEADGRPALGEHELQELVRTGSAIEAHFGQPQDIEWAIAKDGKLWIVQTRPITTLHPLPRGAEGAKDLRIYFSGSVGQGVLQPVTPMGVQFFQSVSAGLARALGSPGADEDAGSSIMAPAAGWLFIDVSGLARSPLGRRLLRAAFGIMEARSAAALDTIFAEPRLAAHPTTRRALVALVLRFAERTRIPPRALRALLRPAGGPARVRRAGDVAVALGDTPADASIALRLRAVERLFREGFPFVFFHVAPELLAGMVAWQLARRLLGPSATDEELEVVRRALPHNPTTEMDLALWAVARADPAAVEPALAAFLAMYGHRGVAEIDVGVPRMREDPAALRATLANYRALPESAEAPDARFARGAREAEAMVVELRRRGRARGLLRGRAAGFALDRMRLLLGLREAPKFQVVRVIARAREHLIAIGAQLELQGRLVRRDDVFFLTLPELRAAAAGTDMRATVMARRVEHQRERRRKHLPRFLYSDGTEPVAASRAPTAGAGVLVGTPASTGTVEGIACVVRDPAGARIAPGEILVAPSTDPGWTPLFLTAGGLVMEMGGAMSHGSVVAREHGIPAVVGVPGATERITSGMRLRVDGRSGTVEIIEPRT